MRTASPGLTTPAEIRPLKPRKSRFGRLTHCTGMQNGLGLVGCGDIELDRLQVIDQGRPGDTRGCCPSALVMLSPLKPEMGMGE